MSTYNIYQVKPEHIRDYGFCGLRELIRTGRAKVREGNEKEPVALPRERWELVYVLQTEKEPSLDWIFTKFQRTELPWEQRMETGGIPEDFTGHSMSVSDIVEDPDGRLWFCDSFGWREVRWV